VLYFYLELEIPRKCKVQDCDLSSHGCKAWISALATEKQNTG